MNNTRSPFRNKNHELRFLRSIGMKKRRLIEGIECQHLLTVLALVEPTSSTKVIKNQKTFIEIYHHAGKEYELTWGFDSQGSPKSFLEEITHYDIQQDSTT